MLAFLKGLLARGPTPRSAAEPIARGDAARDAMRWEEAARHYAEAAEREPGRAATWIQLGNMHKDAGDYAAAGEAYRQALALAPGDADLRMQIGHLCKRLGAAHDAAESYRQALGLDPDRYDAYRELEVLGRSRDADAIRHARTPAPPHRIAFDVSDLLFYVGHHDHLSGIQRVQASIVMAILRGGLLDRDAVRFVAFDRIGNRFRVVHTGQLIALLADLAGPRRAEFDREQARVGRLFAMEPLQASPQGGAEMLVALGQDWGLAGYPAAVAEYRRRPGARFAMMFHDLIPAYAEATCEPGSGDAFRAFLAQIVGQVDLALCVSQSTAADLARYCREHGLAAPPATVTRLGSSFAEFMPGDEDGDDARPGAALPLDDPYVLFVSTLEPRKNHAYALAIWRRMLALSVPVPRLVCVGRRGWRAEEFFTALPADPALSAKVSVLEDVDDPLLARLYAGCLFTIYPSLYEGWGLPVGESLAHGKVCVLSRRASLPEVAGEHGVYIPLDDLAAATAVVAGLIGDPDRLRRLESEIRDGFRPIGWRDVAATIIAACAPADPPMSQPSA